MLNELNEAALGGRSRREERAIAFFGTWMITGLFLDGWAHQVDKPETFFSPWHGILYSGFAAAVGWFAFDGWRHPRGTRRGLSPTDRLAARGLVIFVIGAVGDGLWHEVFGVEVDLEALVSPSHLALLVGGFLMVTAPVRAAAGDLSEETPRWSEWVPQAITLTLAMALVSFFTQYLSVFSDLAGGLPAGAVLTEYREVVDLASILATNTILMISSIYVLRRWRPPAGTFALMYGGVALAMTGLEAFRAVELVIPFVVAGIVADLLTQRGARISVVVGAASVSLWSLFFFVAEITYGLTWSPELWSGAVVLAGLEATLAAGLNAPQHARVQARGETVH